RQDASYPTTDGTRDGFRPNIKLAISDPTPLPVELYDFGGIRSGQVNLLYWTTFSESNSSHFNLQQSQDGTDWVTVATVNASGFSTHRIDYYVTDYSVRPIVNYYRLQQYDFDGAYETFGPISIDNTDTGRFVVKRLNMKGEEVPLDRELAPGIYLDVYNDGTVKKVRY
ncbi:MAG: hypothetical protein ACKODS_04710, partial [Methylophilaceae bacterium]